MTQPAMTFVSGTKRSIDQTVSGVGMRRARYAAKACDACRRRKGRCNGNNPCDYCIGRDQDCSYSITSNEWNRRMRSLDGGHSIQQCVRPASGKAENLTDLAELVTSLRGQLDSLAAQVQQQSTGAPQTTSSAQSQANVQGNSNSIASSDPALEVASQTSSTHASAQHSLVVIAQKRVSRRFWGPTSPDFSLNTARMRATQELRFAARTPGNNINEIVTRSTMDSHSDDETGSNQGEEDNSKSSTQASDGLFWFRNFLSPERVIQLLKVYQTVVGDLHRVVNVGDLITQVGTWSDPSNAQQDAASAQRSSMDEDDLILINLALAIALCADPRPDCDTAREIYSHCKEVLDCKLASTVTNINHIVIVLLMAFYHFFRDLLSVSWLLCGIAGSMAMELGLHSTNIPAHILDSDHSKDEIVAILCTIIILDRQWSSATGLPTHFPEGSFDKTLVATVKLPYLKAMIGFTLISDKFGEPISRVAKGATVEDDDTFEVISYQVEQWRKRVLANHNFEHPTTWGPMLPPKYPAWTLLLYLRANSVRCLLIRPFFLSNNNPEASARNVQPALDFIRDTIDCLSILDTTTSVYREQHPHFQHSLASACALLSLLISHAKQNCYIRSLDFPLAARDCMAKSFEKALTLAEKYRRSFRASQRLWKRLILMRAPLYELAILDRDATDPQAAKLMPIPGTPSLAHHTLRSNLGGTETGQLSLRESFPTPSRDIMGTWCVDDPYTFPPASTELDEVFDVQDNLDWAKAWHYDWITKEPRSLY